MVMKSLSACDEYQQPHRRTRYNSRWAYRCEQEVVVREVGVESRRKGKRLPFRVDECLICRLPCTRYI